MEQLLKKVAGIIQRNRKKKWVKAGVMSAACLVVFVTTYALILPAITISLNQAEEEPGFDVASQGELLVSDGGSDLFEGSGAAEDISNSSGGELLAGDASEDIFSDEGDVSALFGGDSDEDDEVVFSDSDGMDSYGMQASAEETSGPFTCTYSDEEIMCEVSAELLDGAVLPADTQMTARIIYPDSETGADAYTDIEETFKEALASAGLTETEEPAFYQLAFEKDGEELITEETFAPARVTFHFYETAPQEGTAIVAGAYNSSTSSAEMLQTVFRHETDGYTITADLDNAVSVTGIAKVRNTEKEEQETDEITFESDGIVETETVAETKEETSPVTEPEEYSAEVPSEEVTEEITEKVTEEITEEVTEEITEQADQKETEEETESVSEEETKEQTESVTEEETESVSEEETEIQTEFVTEVETEALESIYEDEQEEETESITEEETEEETESISEEETEELLSALTFEGADYTIQLTYGADADIPEDAFLDVREIEKGSEEYEMYLAASGMALEEEGKANGSGEHVEARFFDITIMHEDQKIEPKGRVSVDISYHEALAVAEDGEVNAVHFDESGESATVLEATPQGEGSEVSSVSFDTDSFSVFGIVYTVDFEYSVDGKMYQFSLPGGGFVSFTDLVEVLGIIGDTNSEENGDENGVYDEGKETGINTQDVNDEDSSAPLTLGDVEVSEDTRKFVTDVESVEFSNPELVWVGKVENETTVGGLKEANELEVEYSAELTEEQIAEINAQTVEAGDWALISVHPFTSEESLTVTMKDGEVFTIRVTDAQIKKTVIDAKGDTWEITVTYGEDAQIPDGAELRVEEILLENEEYEQFYQQASEVALGDAETQGMEYPVVAGAHLFDIEIRSGEEKVEPAAPVQVDIRLVGAEADLLSVIHFAEKGPEAMTAEKGEVAQNDALLTDTKATRTEETDDAEATNAEIVVSAVTFRAEAFSVYTVVSVNDASDLISGGPYALVSQNGPGIFAVGENNTNTSTDIMKYALTDTTMTADDGSALKGKVVYLDTSANPNLVGGDVTEWYFESVQGESGRYRIYTLDSSNHKHYIKSTYDSISGNAYLATDTSDGDHFVITVSDGKVRMYLPVDNAGNWYITNMGSNPSYFRETNDNADNDSTLFTIGKLDPDYEEKTAKKVSAADWKAAEGVSGRWNESDTVIIYRRVLHDDGSENLYALATDGTWVPAYDGGDSIFYHCPEGKSVDWHVTYTDQGYYISDIGNTVYLAPSYSNGQWSSTTPVGLTVRGLDSDSDYGSTIEVWDQAAYAYAGLHLPLDADENVTGNVQPGTGENDDTFLFAVSSTLISDGTLHKVDTVDSTSLGITMKMFNYDGPVYNHGYRNGAMQAVLGDDMLDDWDNRKSHVTAMVGNVLGEDGFPYSLTADSLAPLFTPGETINYPAMNEQFWYGPGAQYDAGSITVDGKEANHLFLQSYYDENGMFRYSSMENFAHLTNNTGTYNGTTAYNFDVYRETGTPNIPTASDHYYYYHGHFMPYNELDPTVSVSRIVDQYGSLEDKQEGRSYENVYGLTDTPDYYTGMSLEANFVQPHDGTLANGDPVIYRFTGDDDLWVFIDGVLVLDVGGIHEPLTGSINFETGVVSQPNFYGQGDGWENHTTTLYKIFEKAHKNGELSDEAWNKLKWKDVDGDGTPDTFDDYTTHNFKMFYLERGAGASNLDLMFNLQVVKPNEFTVKKELPEDIDTRFVNHTYKYKATFIDKNGEEKPLYKGVKNSDNSEVCIKIIYNDLRDPVTGQPIEKEVEVDKSGYFYLKPNEAAVFTMANEHIQYNVREVTIDETQISRVDINNVQTEITTSSVSEDGREAVAGPARVEDRSNVIYKNYPYTRALNITKHLTDDSAPLEPGEMPVFEFRVYLESTVTEGDPPKEVHKLVPYSYGPYYVTKEVNGVTHYYTLTGINNAPEDQGTDPVICSETGRSGSINSIPPEYTVVIPNLMVGTHFYVEERRDNIPAGYFFDHEVLTPGTFDFQTLGTENEIIGRVLARDSRYENADQEQPFDINTVGKIISTADAESHVYNRKEAVDVPVEKSWSFTSGTTPESVTMALVRFKLPEPEVIYTPAQGKGAVRINHVAHYGVDSENDASLPGDFVARYTITNKTTGEAVIRDTTERGPFDLDAGEYTITVTVVRSADPEDYVYVSTDSVDVTVVEDQTEIVKLTSVYREEKSGFIEITHVASGLEDTTELPSNFTGTYSIRNASGQFVHSNVSAGTYAVAPGTYTVIANVIDPAAPEGYSYVSTSNAEGVIVVGEHTTTAQLTSTYVKNGMLTFSHTAVGLDNTTLPEGFTATYTINGPITINNAQPGHAYSVAPGEYTVIAHVANPAAPTGKSYLSTTSAEDVIVASGGSATPELVSTYIPTPEDGYVRFTEEFVDASGNSIPKPENFAFGYDISGPTSYQSVGADQQKYVEPGAYTFSANKWNDGSNDSYTYVETVVDPASTTITGGLTTVTVTHRYSRVLEKGYITIQNKSVNLPDSPTMPANFSANYRIVDDATGEVVNGFNSVQADTPYSIAPGRYRIELDQIGYEGNNVSPYVRTDTPSVTVDVGEAENVTAEVKHYYEVSGNAMASVHVRVDHNGGEANTSAVLTEVPKNTSVYLSYSDFNYGPWGNQYYNPGWELFYYDDSNEQWKSTGTKVDSNGAGINTEVPIGVWDKYCIVIKFNPLDDAIEQINPRLTFEPISVSDLPDANASQLALNLFANYKAGNVNNDVQDINLTEGVVNASPTRVENKTIARSSAAPRLAVNPFTTDSVGDVNDGVQDINPLTLTIPQSVLDGLPKNYTLDVSYGKGFVLDGTGETPWKKVIEVQSEFDIYGQPYYYALVEVEVPENFEVSYENNPISAEILRQNMDDIAAAHEAGAELPALLTLNAINTSTIVNGDLQVTKTVKHNGEIDSVHGGKDLTFYVGLFEDSTSTVAITGTVKPITVASGYSTGTVFYPDLTIGEQYYVFETDASGNKLAVNDKFNGYTVTVNGALSDAITQTPTVNVDVENNKLTGDLELTKRVAGVGADETKEFDFTVFLEAPEGETLSETYPFTKTGIDGEQTLILTRTDNNTKAEFTVALAHSQTWSIKGLPDGTSYQIIEDNYSNVGYSPSTTIGRMTGTIAGGITATNEVTVTNTYEPGKLVIEKTLDGNAAESAKPFEFKILIKPENGNNGNGDAGSYTINGTTTNIRYNTDTSFSLKGGEKAEFTIKKAGATFTVEEVSADQGGYETTVKVDSHESEAKTVTGRISKNAAITVEYINKRDKTSAESTKVWKTGSKAIGWPEDVQSVEFTLYKTVNDQKSVVTADDLTANGFSATGFENPTTVENTTSDLKVIWPTLPTQYWLAAVEGDPGNGINAVTAGWYPATYMVEETKVVYKEESGKAALTTAESIEEAYNPMVWNEENNTITNNIPLIEISGTKTWSVPGDQITDPTLKLTRISSAQNATEETVRNAEDTADLQPIWSGEGNTRTYTYEDLPKYDAEGYLYTYSVKETGFTYDGVEYVINTDGTVLRIIKNTDTNEDTTEPAAYWTMVQVGRDITNTLDPVSLDVIKARKGDVAVKLRDAEFQLTRKNSSGAYVVFENAKFAEDTETHKRTGSFTVGSTGEITITDLVYGDYKLKETKAPDGYIITNDEIFFTLNVDGTVTVTGRNEDEQGNITYSASNNLVTFAQKTNVAAAKVTVENEPGAALPNTGGPGTRIFTILGSILILGAGALLWRRRRFI